MRLAALLLLIASVASAGDTLRVISTGPVGEVANMAEANEIRVSKAMGYVNDAFDSETLAKLPGSLALGHVRYSTAGESRLTNAQPIVVDSVHGQLAVAHNGNLVNAGELRDALVRNGAIFQTSSDTEVIVHLFARSRAEGAEGAIVEAISQVRGAFSFVMMTKDRLVGVRPEHLEIGTDGEVKASVDNLDLASARILRTAVMLDTLGMRGTGSHDVRGLIMLAQWSTVEIHAWGCREDDLENRSRREVERPKRDG